MVHHHQKVAAVSPERIVTELQKMLIDANRLAGLTLLHDSGLNTVVFADLPADAVARGRTVLASLPQFSSTPTPPLIAAALFATCPPDAIDAWCRRMHTSNAFRERIIVLVTDRDTFLTALPLTDGRLKQWLFKPHFTDLLALCRAVLTAESRDASALDTVAAKIAAWGGLTPPKPLLDGHDLMAMGIDAGPQLGKNAGRRLPRAARRPPENH